MKDFVEAFIAAYIAVGVLTAVGAVRWCKYPFSDGEAGVVALAWPIFWFAGLFIILGWLARRLGGHRKP